MLGYSDDPLLDDSYLTSRKNSLELVEPSSLIVIEFIFSHVVTLALYRIPFTGRTV
jgi:hypothetical protein